MSHKFEPVDTKAEPMSVFNRSFCCLAGWGFIIASVFVGLFFFLSFIGYCLYLYIDLGAKDLIFGSGIGVLHIGIRLSLIHI